MLARKKESFQSLVGRSLGAGNTIHTGPSGCVARSTNKAAIGSTDKDPLGGSTDKDPLGGSTVKERRGEEGRSPNKT